MTFNSTQPGTAGTQYVFGSWENSSTSAARVITAPASAATYTATFGTQYQLTTSASPSAGGSTTPASGSFYNSGTVVNLQATPNTNYTFNNRTGSTVASASSASATVTMIAPETVAANFTLQYSLNVSVTPANSGAITGTLGGGQPFSCSSTCSATGNSGSTLTLTATPAAGFTFSSWSACPSPSGASCIVTQSGAVTISAVFTGSTSLAYTQGALVLNRTTQVYSRTVTITNSGPATSTSAYVADGLPVGVSMVNLSGTTSATTPVGSPYIELGPLGANSSITATIQFTRNGSQAITYTARILGDGPR